MLKPAVKQGKAWTVENGVYDGVMVDGHGQGYEEVEIVSSHHHHHWREPAGSVTASPEDAKRARKEARRLERERGRERRKWRRR